MSLWDFAAQSNQGIEAAVWPRLLANTLREYETKQLVTAPGVVSRSICGVGALALERQLEPAILTTKKLAGGRARLTDTPEILRIVGAALSDRRNRFEAPAAGGRRPTQMLRGSGIAEPYQTMKWRSAPDRRRSGRPS